MHWQHVLSNESLICILCYDSILLITPQYISEATLKWQRNIEQSFACLVYKRICTTMWWHNLLVWIADAPQHYALISPGAAVFCVPTAGAVRSHSKKKSVWFYQTRCSTLSDATLHSAPLKIHAWSIFDGSRDKFIHLLCIHLNILMMPLAVQPQTRGDTNPLAVSFADWWKAPKTGSFSYSGDTSLKSNSYA